MRIFNSIFVAVFLISVSSSAQSKSTPNPVAVFLEEAEGLGFEDLDEACGDCVSPEYLLENYTKLMKKVKPSEQVQLTKGFKEIIEKQRAYLKGIVGQSKLIKITPQGVDQVIAKYLKKVDGVKP
ncbi:MAG TPA: hypothetical protein VM901_12190 [Bdellovibrionota bacterium]|jgi:hypothetical protein|nr:hypothetical protein [Bdellovibrionota bacterium]